MNKPKLRRGVGWVGRVLLTNSAVNERGAAELRHTGPVEAKVDHVRKLNKEPEFRRAAKRAHQRSDAKYHSED